MAKKKTEAKEVKEIAPYEGFKTYIATAKSKHLKEGNKIELTYEMASQFIKLGYING